MKHNARIENLTNAEKAQRDIEKIEILKITGQEWTSLTNISKQYDISKTYLIELMARLQKTHEIRVLKIAPHVVRVNVLDFRRALLETCPVQPGICGCDF